MELTEQAEELRADRVVRPPATRHNPSGRKPNAFRKSTWFWAILAVVLAFIVFLPLVQLQTRAFAEGAAGVRRFLELPGIGETISNTFILAFGSLILAVIFGTTLAICTTRLPARARSLVSIAPVIPLAVPAIAGIVGWVFLFSPRVGVINQWLRATPLFGGTTGPIDIFTLPAIVIFTGLNLTSFVYLFVHAGLRQRGAELEIAAAACGASGIRAFLTVTLPLLRPAIAYSSGIVFLLALGQFTAPLLLGASQHIDVLATRLYRLRQEFPIDYAAGAAIGIPLIVAGVIVVVLQRRAVGDEKKYVSATAKSAYVATNTSWWAAVPLMGYLLIVVVLPVAALVVTSLSPFWTGKVEPGHFTISAYVDFIQDPRSIAAISTTVLATAFALVIVLPLGLAAAFALLSRSGVPRILRSTIDVLSSLSLSMPAALFGFAMLFTYSGPPLNLYGSVAIIGVVYVALMIPHAVRPQLSSLVGLGADFGEASRTCGASPFQTLVRITLPLVRGGIAVAATICIVLLSHEFSASIMVKSPSTNVLGTLLFEQWGQGTYPGVAVIGLVLVAVTMVGLGIAAMVGGTRSLEKI